MELARGFGVAGYRSFGSAHIQPIGPLTKVNLVAGQNNVGKSNVLRAAALIGTTQPRPGWNPQRDVPVGWPSNEPLRIAIAVELSDDDVRHRFGEGLVRPLRSDAIRLTADDLAWVTFAVTYETATSGRPSESFQIDEAWMESLLSDAAESSQGFREASSRIASIGGGARYDDARRVLESLKARELVPPVTTINAFRQIREVFGGGEPDHDGGGLIGTLAGLDRPDAGDVESEVRFRRIQEFVRIVLDDPTISIEIPRRADTINVRRGQVSLPLENQGTGIHQVVILAAAATVLSGHLVCIEEPEVHLHPVLQRKLLRYLADSTDNQYLVATHSAHLLDSDLATILHATWSPSGTQVRRALTSNDRAQICADLGYRPSDLVQANAIIWVEGPSDRIYVRHWLTLCDPDLVEGLHYSVMFYGGRLLNHLSPNDPDVEDFISLRRLNRSVAILIDSDKRSSRAHINTTKQRVARDLEDGGFAWITKGYTIENLVPKELLRSAVEATHHRAQFQDVSTEWENPLDKGHTGLDSVDKVRIARHVASAWDVERYPLQGDLLAKVQELVTFVRAANGHAAPTLNPNPVRA